VEALEKFAKSILERLQLLEERIDTLDQAPRSTMKPSSPTETLGDGGHNKSSISIDTEAVKKGLLSKMWKYLNDDRPPNPA